MKGVFETTCKVVQYLLDHPKVESVIYPFWPTHPQYDLAKRQMKAGAGLFRVVLKVRDVEAVEKFCNQLKRFYMACSWGGYESLIYPAAALMGAKRKDPSTFNHIRFYIGLEEPDVLIQDLEQAFHNI